MDAEEELHYEGEGPVVHECVQRQQGSPRGAAAAAAAEGTLLLLLHGDS